MGASLSGPAVFVANHMSTAETQLLPGLIQPIRDVTFVVKDALVKGPVFGPIMRAIDGIGVAQKDARQDFETVMREGCDRLSKGMSVVIFPEGTRNRLFDLFERLDRAHELRGVRTFGHGVGAGVARDVCLGGLGHRNAG